MPDKDTLLQEIRDAIHSAIDAKVKSSDAEHDEHHNWVREQIERSKARTEFWTALAAKSLPAMLWSLLAAGATALWHVISTHMNWR